MSDPPKHHLSPSSVQPHTRSLHDLSIGRCQNTFTCRTLHPLYRWWWGLWQGDLPSALPNGDSTLTATQVSSHRLPPSPHVASFSLPWPPSFFLPVSHYAAGPEPNAHGPHVSLCDAAPPQLLFLLVGAHPRQSTPSRPGQL